MFGIKSQVKDIISDVNPSVDMSEADFERLFSDIGIDSLDFAGILLRVEEDLGVKIDDADVNLVLSPKLLCNYLEKKKRG